MKTWIRRSEALKVFGAWLAWLLIVCGVWLASILYFLESDRRANAIQLGVNKIRIHELEARRAEKDFMLRSLTDPAFFLEGRSEYLDRHQARIVALKDEVENLGALVPSGPEPRTSHLLEMVDRYERGFRELVSAYRARGFEQSGLEGTLRNAMIALDRAIERTQEPALVRAALNLGRDQQAFLLHASAENRARVADDLAALRRALAEEKASEGAPSILKLVAAYEEALARLGELQEKIGITEEMGLQGELRKAIHAVEPVVDRVVDEAVLTAERAGRRLMIGVLATCLIMAVLLAAAVFFAQAARFHNRRLVQLNVQMEEDHRKLLQSERLAAIGQMVTGLAHESRNAIQRTHACLDMLAQEVQDRPQALDLVSRIEESQDYLHVLYEQVREYAAPLHVKRAITRLDKVVLSAWEHLELARKGREVGFKHCPDGLDLFCEVDGFAIEQVFRNIFENSLAACQDPVEIEVRYREGRVLSRSVLEVSVADNGPGLDPEQRGRIFEPFFTTKTKGTGLGMAISKRLVEEHGGAIEVGQGASRGAEILVTLPRSA